MSEPQTVTEPAPLALSEVIVEFARRAERAAADARYALRKEYRGPSHSSAARRDAHLGDLALLSGLEHASLVAALQDGNLVEAVGGTWVGRHRECDLCRRLGPVVLAKLSPKSQPVPVCRDASTCRDLPPAEDAQ